MKRASQSRSSKCSESRSLNHCNTETRKCNFTKRCKVNVTQDAITALPQATEIDRDIASAVQTSADNHGGGQVNSGDSDSNDSEADGRGEDDHDAEFDKPIFVYGSLQHPAILFRAMYPYAAMTEKRIASVEKRMAEASIQGYQRRKVNNAPYPAAIKCKDSSIIGSIYRPRTAKERTRLISFEEEEYRPVKVQVSSGSKSCLKATLFLWHGSLGDLGEADWNFQDFCSSETCAEMLKEQV